jgi:hypothetical protein
MSLLVLALLAATPGAATPSSRAGAKAAADAPRETPAPSTIILRKKSDHAQQTQCGLCHATSSWVDVRFNHERTGFPLTGAHTTVTCKECHSVDFVRPLPRNCVGCHIDVHTGELGARCEGCHDTTSWRSRIDVDAHRRTNFPLLGAHAALPCTECHFEARERRFVRAMVTCGSGGCHQADYLNTNQPSHQNVRPVPFDAQRCQLCHGPFRFIPAKYAEHDTCFVTTRGSHSGLSCISCHGPSAFTSVSIGTCNSSSGQLRCSSCHVHLCADMDRLHAQRSVQGYSCTDRKCYECHAQDGKGP